MRCLLLALLLTVAVQARAQVDYVRYFTDQTLRVDYFHSGTKGHETVSLDAAMLEGSWAGSRVNLIDTLNLGEYMFTVCDLPSNRMIYSRGYSTMFNEWQTTDEAGKGIDRTFSESLRFPAPRRRFQLNILRRDRQMVFREIFSTTIDPDDPTAVNKETRPMPYNVETIMDHGSPSTKVDIVILGDGYTKEEMGKFRRDARHFNDVMFATSPFKEHRNDFNVRMVDVASSESGIDMPDKDVWKNTALGTQYNTFGSARYVLTEENKAVRDAAACAPYDFICILVNDARYGGGGIFQLYTTTYTKEAVDSVRWQMDYVYVHEFGHSFAGLGDEYYSSSTAYNDFYPRGVEPWEPNITALLNPANLKWKSLLTKGIEIPTPWEKAAYDSVQLLLGKLDRLAPDYYKKRAPMYEAGRAILAGSRFAGMVGAFEGAGYASTGLYRPSVDCRMFSLSLVGFDPVCSAAIARMIGFYAH